jgi:heme/copper-type cytochrome/quinol oxidase subunit 2
VDCLGPGLVVPAGQTTRITLNSQDVIHGFYVPEFNFSRYAQPGVTNVFDLTVQHSGIYRAQCTQLCGLYHSLMFFNVRSVSPTAYAAWLRTTRAFQTAHPTSIGQLPAALHANQNGTVPSSGNSGSGNTGNTGGVLYGD